MSLSWGPSDSAPINNNAPNNPHAHPKFRFPVADLKAPPNPSVNGPRITKYEPSVKLVCLLFARRLGYDTPMRVLLHQPRREVEIRGPRRVCEVLKELKLIPETVLVIRGEDLVTEDEMVRDEETLEIRPVISGGGLNFHAL